MPQDDAEVTLGYISGVHGLKGWVKVHSYTDPREAILEYQPWRLAAPGDGNIAQAGGGQVREVCIERGQPHGKTLIAALPGVSTPEQGRALVGQEIRVPRSALPDSGEDSWYWRDLIGLSVVNEEDIPLGTVKQMIETGANDVMVLEGERERLVPFVNGQVVRSVDLDARQIRVDWHPDD
ncbi:MAG: ribosome maturation factor RimM [Xanthomonadales bacterium]|nr:ribosome maturation factor RimM [Xanthomonadales bacterium]